MRSNLFKRGFLSLLVAQFLGAANDNVLKTLLIFMVVATGSGVWAGDLGEGGPGLVAFVMFAPFIFFSGYAGQIADRYSKRRVVLAIKVVEVPIALIAMIGFWTHNLWVTLVAMLLLATQSAFFGPAKYGMLPEIVDDSDLSRANGTINMLTNIGVIGGTVYAGWVAVRYAPPADGATGIGWLPGASFVGIAVVGLLAAFYLPHLRPQDPDLKWNLNPFSGYGSTLRDMAKGPLLDVALAWGFFYFIAGLALLVLPEYEAVLEINQEIAARILGVLAVAIGIGSGLAGLISGHRIEPRLVPIGAAGISLFFLLLGFFANSLTVVCVLVFGAGVSAGFYIIPLQALLQHLSPDDERGRFIGTANAISFSFLTLASLLFMMIRGWFGDSPHRLFLVCGVLMLTGGAYFVFRLRRTMFASENTDPS